MVKCHLTPHWWVQDGPWAVRCEVCGTVGRIVLIDENG